MVHPKKLRELLQYNPETGALTWRVDRPGHVRAGDVAGTPNGNGYLRVRVDGHRYYAHCVAWVLHYGAWPKKRVDHRDGVRSNNSIRNLREATNAVNAQNNLKGRRCNPWGFAGVSYDKTKRKFQSGIGVNGVRMPLGRYNTPEEAHLIYLTAKLFFHPESFFGGQLG